jgi:hypothetical protein
MLFFVYKRISTTFNTATFCTFLEYNAKRNLLGINNQIKDEYQQNYLDEFCYKTNRRYFGNEIFKRLVVVAVNGTWYGKRRYLNG